MMMAEPDAAAAAAAVAAAVEQDNQRGSIHRYCRRYCRRASEPARQHVEADLGEGDGPSTQQIVTTVEPDAVAAAAAVGAAVEQENERGRVNGESDSR